MQVTWVGKCPNISPKWSKNGPKMAPKWLPGGLKMAPWRLLGGLWRPWGALGRPRRIFERFWELWGFPFGNPKAIKKAFQNKLKSNIAVDAYFRPSGGPLGHFWEPRWRYFWVLFWSQRREAGFLKIVLPLEREHDF